MKHFKVDKIIHQISTLSTVNVLFVSLNTIVQL